MLPSDLMVICILCIKYDKVPAGTVGCASSPGAHLRPVRRTVETLAATSRNSRTPVCVLPELKSVTRRDIDDWIAEVTGVLRRHVSEAEFNKMFDDGQSLPMDDAIKHLEGVLDSQPRN